MPAPAAALVAAPFLAAGAAPSGYGSIRLRGGGACMDTAGATDTSPVRTAACVAGQTSQMFVMASNGYIHMAASGCNEGPPCCIEHFFSDITVWGCSDPSGKTWSYENATGAISSGGAGCATAPAASGGGVSLSACDAKDAAQAWDLVAGAVPPAPPQPTTCAQIGCPQSWTPGLPCQCNPTCGQYSNCCADYATVCGHGPAPPAPPGQDSCAKIGCPADWTPGLPCQCNPTCGQYGNCCTDYKTVCGGQ